MCIVGVISCIFDAIFQVDIFVPDGERLRSPSGSVIINRLTVTMSRQCDDKTLPHENMSEQCECYLCTVMYSYP
mgnify:CR=1 FL=1